MVVMGGIVGSGIFVTPAIVASWTRTREEMLSAWLVGGAAALLGAFIYADLSRRRPFAGGQYVYLREAYHPALGFLYGWALLLVIQTGGMAVCAMTFGRYFRQLAGVAVGEGALAALAIGSLTLINCLGVGAGARVQSALMVLKIVAIAALIAAGFTGAPSAAQEAVKGGTSFVAALVPVLFSYGGFQTACFVAGEMKDPGRDLPRALVPVAASALPGAVAIALALAGTYEVLLRYVVAIDFIFFALVASCLFVFRARGEPISMPGHPLSTLLFIGVCAAVVISTFARDPVHSLIGLALTLAGFPVYLLWRKAR